MVGGRSIVLFLVALTLRFACAATGRQQPATQPSSPPQETNALTNADVINIPGTAGEYPGWRET